MKNDFYFLSILMKRQRARTWIEDLNLAVKIADGNQNQQVLMQI
jgi:hypothetical protein